jgi:predicted nuclease with TOPRIM domain
MKTTAKYAWNMLEYAGICRRYRLMLDEKFKEIVRLRDEVIKHQNTISAQNQQIRNLQKDNSKLKKALQKQKKEINGKS